MYSPELGRFHNMDVLSQVFPGQSPFVYANNNPVRYIDFMGMSAESPDSTSMNVNIDPVVVQGANQSAINATWRLVGIYFSEAIGAETNYYRSLSNQGQFLAYPFTYRIPYSNSLVASNRLSPEQVSAFKTTFNNRMALLRGTSIVLKGISWKNISDQADAILAKFARGETVSAEEFADFAANVIGMAGPIGATVNGYYIIGKNVAVPKMQEGAHQANQFQKNWIRDFINACTSGNWMKF